MRKRILTGTFLILAVLTFSTHPFGFCQSADALVAIDILLEPDSTMADRARAENARLRKDYPEGFALDATHAPHISVLQCYVRTSDLDRVFSVLEQAARARKPEGMELTTTGYFTYSSKEGVGLAVIAVALTPELREYQRTLINAVRPFMMSNGTAAAFVPNENGDPIGGTTVADIETYISHSGDHYRPHVTIGLGHEALLRKMMAAPFTPFKFKVQNAAVYHLGDFGTARKKIWSSAPPEEKVWFVRDLPPAGALPENFRTMDMIVSALKDTQSTVSTQGLDTLRASGSAEPWEKAFPELKERFGKDLVLVDLRQESHGFLNGAAVTWFLPPGDWINLGKTRDETLHDEKKRIAKLAGEQTVLVREDPWIPTQIRDAGKQEKVLSVASEEELAQKNGIRYVRFTVPDHMRPSDEDVDRFIAFVRGLGDSDWLHFHCHAGMGRTTTFLAMYDMLKNAGQVSLEDIVARQAAAGPRYNVFQNESGPPWEKVFREREAFVRQFYEYAKAFRAGSKASWSEWLKAAV